MGTPLNGHWYISAYKNTDFCETFTCIFVFYWNGIHLFSNILFENIPKGTLLIYFGSWSTNKLCEKYVIESSLLLLPSLVAGDLIDLEKKKQLRYAKLYNSLAAKLTFDVRSVREMTWSQTLLMAPVNNRNKLCHLLSWASGLQSFGELKLSSYSILKALIL